MGGDTRLISVEALLKLLSVKEMADQESTIGQIRALLQPLQTTKLDGIIDIVFSTALDVEDGVKSQSVEAEEAEGEGPKGKQVRTPSEQLEAKRESAAESLGKARKLQFVKQRRTLYQNGEGDVRLCVVVSKRYGKTYQPYWYGYHTHWNEFLREGKTAFLVLACMDRTTAYAIPYATLAPLLTKLNKSEASRRSYWHLPLTQLESGELALNVSLVGKKVSLKPFEYPLQA